MPGAVDLAPIAGRLPSLAACGRKAIHQPERGGRVAAVVHESEPIGIGDEVAVELDGPDKRAMRRLLIVEVEAVVRVADGVDAFVERNPCVACAGCGGE